MEPNEIFTCACCGQYATALTQVHRLTRWCTGCLLRELRPFDFTREVSDRDRNYFKTQPKAG